MSQNVSSAAVVIGVKLAWRYKRRSPDTDFHVKTTGFSNAAVPNVTLADNVDISDHNGKLLIV